MLPIRDHERPSTVPIVTIALVVVNVFVFVQELLAPNLDAFIRQWALVPAAMDLTRPASLLPLLTSQFLHAGFAHIAFNMWFLWIFGDNVEAALGRFRFLFFYLLSGVVAALVELPFIAGTNIPMLGASGAVAGVLGAYWAWFPRHRIDALVPDLFIGFPMRATLPAGVVLLFWFVGQLLNGVASVATGTAAIGGVAFWAHIGGFVFGWSVARMIGMHRGVRVIRQ
ncbi:rhomboid family intramembrane serine protease [Candidatus Uhrbacteria bacterium]|nr:rhomboid family intramembrane serine protease [Candidatus Uhrbacteria bacterium]